MIFILRCKGTTKVVKSVFLCGSNIFAEKLNLVLLTQISFNSFLRISSYWVAVLMNNTETSIRFLTIEPGTDK